jgi:hypothetical protein
VLVVDVPILMRHRAKPQVAVLAGPRLLMVALVVTANSCQFFCAKELTKRGFYLLQLVVCGLDQAASVALEPPGRPSWRSARGCTWRRHRGTARRWSWR